MTVSVYESTAFIASVVLTSFFGKVFKENIKEVDIGGACRKELLS
jgi:hypothetical protein